MKKCTYYFFLLLASFHTICGSCVQPTSDGTDIGRIPFTINPLDRCIVIPIKLNDSITAHLTWDTGAVLGTFKLDSAFCSKHPSIIGNMLPDKILSTGSAWKTRRTPTLVYKNSSTIKIGNADLHYNQLRIFDRRVYMNNRSKSNGLFNIPPNDTTHIWELNFEHNYLQIHSSDSFDMPKECFVVPLVKEEHNPYPFNIKLPLKLKLQNGDTLTLNHTFMLDTGMPQDLALLYRADELTFFNEQKDAVWLQDDNPVGYFRYYTVDGNLFGSVQMDSLRVYTYDSRNDVRCQYLVGLNFLKRFNVYFDIKNQQVGLQPIKNFQRVVNPVWKRFHIYHPMNSQGKFIVTKVADYNGSCYKIAGMKEGDEVISINGKKIKEYTYIEAANLMKWDRLVYDILRNGKPMTIVVLIKNEAPGD